MGSLSTGINFPEVLMHEMGLVQNIIEILEHQAHLNNASRVVSVQLEFGALTAVLPAAITFAFEILSKGSVMEGAQLDVTIIPIKVSCSDCGKEAILQEYQPFCPACSSPALRITGGRDEMRVASMEIE
jgi:hydrogenase nickel incorporation protein HypA/HybF